MREGVKSQRSKVKGQRSMRSVLKHPVYYLWALSLNILFLAISTPFPCKFNSFQIQRPHIKAAVQWQPRVRTVKEWCRLAANRMVPECFVLPAKAGTNLYCLVIGEQRHMCVNNLPRVARSGGTAGNRTRDLSITNLTPYHYGTPPSHTRST